MKSYLIALLAFFLLLIPVPCAHAGDSAAIYTVDMQRVIDESIAGKAARNNLEAEVKKRQLGLESGRLELERLKADLGKQSSLLSGQALQDKQEQLTRKQKDFERVVQDNREEISKKSEAEMSKVIKQIHEVIDELSKSGDYKMILERDQRFVVYVAPKYDLTEEVIKRVDKKTVS